jgi:hypothetical protein
MIAAIETFVNRGLVFALTLAVRSYQVMVRPLFPALCRFQPSCSEYFLGAIEKHGPAKGACMGVWRVCRCHPLSRGGYDPP